MLLRCWLFLMVSRFCIAAWWEEEEISPAEGSERASVEAAGGGAAGAGSAEYEESWTWRGRSALFAVSVYVCFCFWW